VYNGEFSPARCGPRANRQQLALADGLYVD
jgi:hypothetical protein